MFNQAPEGLTGWTGGTFVLIYLFGLGLLLAQYTITGFDASAHVSEETVGARTEAPKAIVRAIYVSAIAGFFLNLAMTQAIPKDPDKYAVIAFGASVLAPTVSSLTCADASKPVIVYCASKSPRPNK